jgi:hypothetical protein
MNKTTGKYSHKQYKCRRCGAIESHGTNHWGAIYPICKSCSWKHPMKPQSIFDCLEPMPEGIKKPEEWIPIKLGDLLETKDQSKERRSKEMNEKQIEFEKEYSKSENGNFYIVDSIGVPHPYCIGSRHVAHAADHHMGMLDQYAIKSAEKLGIKCQVRGCNLSYEQHEQALLICCKKDLKSNDKINPELHKWLLSIKDKVDSEKKYAGFSFIQYEVYHK